MKTMFGRFFSLALAAMLAADDTSTHNTAVDLEIIFPLMILMRDHSGSYG
jgi:hypothetical protein